MIKHSNIVFCIMYKFHNSYFVIFDILIIKKTNQIIIVCNMYKMHNSYFVMFGNFVNIIVWWFLYFYTFIYYMCWRCAVLLIFADDAAPPMRHLLILPMIVCLRCSIHMFVDKFAPRTRHLLMLSDEFAPPIRQTAQNIQNIQIYKI